MPPRRKLAGRARVEETAKLKTLRGSGKEHPMRVIEILYAARQRFPQKLTCPKTDITSKKLKYESMCGILDFRPPGQQRRRLPGRARLTEAERQRVAIVRRAGACEECRRKKKRVSFLPSLPARKGRDRLNIQVHPRKFRTAIHHHLRPRTESSRTLLGNSPY